MARQYFMRSDRVGFSEWTDADADLARRLWGNPEVTRYICATGAFTDEEVLARLQTEIENGKQYQMQYWPIFRLDDDDFIGCCGLRPHEPRRPELGFHLLPKYWRHGYASEAARRVMGDAFDRFDIDGLTAGHHPENKASEHVLKRLAFVCVGTEYYPPTGLMHPAYRYERGASGRQA